MQAVRIDRFGPPDVLQLVTVIDPQPGPGQVLVDVAFAGVTFVETQVRAGRPPVAAMLPALPVVLGNGVSGVVAAVGPGGDPALLGRRVVAGLAGLGGYAERAVADSTRAVAVPDELDLEVAAAVVADGRTALGLFEAVGEVRSLAGATVLVEAAAGGVGTLLTQLVAQAGSRVIAAARFDGERGAVKRALLASWGVIETVDYSEPGWVAGVRDRVGGVDVVFDGVGGAVGADATTLLRPNGVWCRFGAASGAFTDAAVVPRPDVTRVGLDRIDPARQVGLVRAALRATAEGRLRPVVGQVVDLGAAAAAHAAIEARSTVGKTVLRVR